MINNILYSLRYYVLNNIQTIISTGLYISIILGIWFVFSNSITYIITTKFRGVKYRLNPISNDKRQYNKLYINIKLLIDTVYGRKRTTTIYTYTTITLTLLLLSLIITSKQPSIILKVLIPLISLIAPYTYLLLKLRTIRVGGSYEAESLLAELISQYKMNYFNMIEAIDKSIVNLKEAPYSQSLLLRLSLSLKEYKDEAELNRILMEFTYGVDTEWIRLLSNNIYIAISEEINVVIALEDILIQLRDVTKNMEYSKRLNSESFIIAKYFSPILYIASVIFAIREFDFTLEKFIYLQLYTPTGMRFFLIIVCLTLINTGIVIYFGKQKFDF